MSLRGVLFDAAGTLIELSEPPGETYARVAAAHGVALSPWRIGDAFRRVVAQATPMVFPGETLERSAELEREWWRGVVRSTFLAADSATRFDDFDAFFAELFARFGRPGSWRSRPGARDALRSLRSTGLATGVVSNFDQRLAKILQDLDFQPLLDCVVVPAQVGFAKPSREIFAFALDLLELAPSEAAFVGDDADRDVRGAEALGFRAVDVASLDTLADLPERLGTPAAQSAGATPATGGVDRPDTKMQLSADPPAAAPNPVAARGSRPV